jgi:hypothetical protein
MQLLVETRYLKKGSSAETLSALSLKKLVEVESQFELSTIQNDIRVRLCRGARRNLNFSGVRSGW